jgi:hypothetical protein
MRRGAQATPTEALLVRLEILRDSKEAASAVLHNLGLAASCPTSSSQFEVLRATVWAAAAPRGAVHINRVLAAALPTWRVLSQRSSASEQTLRLELRAALATLEDTGDLLQRGGGYWGVATTRLVDLPSGSGRLIVGGAPSLVLPVAADAIDHHGPHRHVAKPTADLAASLPFESYQSWSRRPAAPLAQWSREMIGSLERQPYSPTSAEAFEFYMPASARSGSPQFLRWRDSPGPVIATLLARRMRVYGAREYRLADVREAQVVGVRDLQGLDVRRLMYALDLDANNPVCARRLNGDHPEWQFKSELPRAEQRIFAAFGTLRIPADRPFERRWVFARNEQVALTMLRELGISLNDNDSGGRR